MAMSVSVFVQSSAFANEPVFSGEKETYIVLTETEKDGKKIQSQYDGEIVCGKEAVSCELTERQAEKLDNQPGVVAVSEDIILEGSEKKSKKKTASTNPEQWNLEAIGADTSKAKPSGVKIEVLDSGVSYTDDINIMGEVNLVPGEEEVSPMFIDANGHGTGIAGLIGAKDNKDGIKGVFPDAEIYSVKAFDENLKSPLSRIIEGIYWGIENDMDIINMSFGTTVNSEVLHQAMKDAEEAGIILIAAAGNTEHQDVNYPAAYDEVIAVGSINAEGKLAELTSTGTELELLAPGEQVCTTGLFYGTIGVSGTSIATAQVTGTAALLKAKDKTKSADFIRGLLKASSKEVEGTNAGLINYKYALEIYDEYAKSYTKGEDTDEKFDNDVKIPDYSNDADVIVEGLWQAQTSLKKPLSSTHGKLVKYAADKTTSKISTDNLNYMARTANLADKPEKYKGTDVFHGKSNYVMSLKFLWKYANLIGKGNTAASAAKTVKADIDKIKAYQSTNKTMINEKNNLKQGIDSAQYMIKEQTNYFKSKGTKLTATNKKFLVMGFIMHLIGDTYAHATIVPKYTFYKVPKEDRHYKVAKFSNDPDDHKSRFGMNEFVATNFFYEVRRSVYNDPMISSDKKVSEFNDRIEKINENAHDKKYKNRLDWGCLFKATELQVLTFRKIKFYMIDSFNDKNGRYEDNINFCPERYRAAKNVSRKYLNQYKNPFNNILISKGYVKLYKFNSYKERV